jgi:hypothetical protein
MRMLTRRFSPRSSRTPLSPSHFGVFYSNHLGGAQFVKANHLVDAHDAAPCLAVAFRASFWGTYRRVTEAARANLQATEWARRAVINALVSNVAASYFQIRALDLQLEISQRTLTTPGVPPSDSYTVRWRSRHHTCALSGADLSSPIRQPHALMNSRSIRRSWCLRRKMLRDSLSWKVNECHARYRYPNSGLARPNGNYSWRAQATSRIQGAPKETPDGN